MAPPVIHTTVYTSFIVDFLEEGLDGGALFWKKDTLFPTYIIYPRMSSGLSVSVFQDLQIHS